MTLPVQLTTFVGREHETDALVDLLAGARLVSLTGPGGAGKTRLAAHVAERVGGGVRFADLSPIGDESAVARVLAETVGARAPTTAAIVEPIADAPLLLIVDNCEHLVDASAGLIDELLRAAPLLTVLATSREPLGVEGEVTYRIPPLEAADAAALFVERAGRARPGRTAPDAAVVDDICQRLDGMPLAIELAAARMRVLSADQIRDGLHDRFRLLTGGARTAVPRQQTLQASVEWSHDLLQENERVVLRRLSVFAGGFTLDAAEAVIGWDPIEAHHVLDLVSQLVDKSLVVGAGDDRFRLLETVRQYAVTKLLDAGEAEHARRRHYDEVLAQAWRRRDAGETDTQHRARVRADIDNVRKALQWAVEQPDPRPIVELTSRLYAYWVHGANLREGADWTAHAVERTVGASPDVRAPLLRRYSQLRGLSGDWTTALDAATETIEIARATGDHRNLVLALVQAVSAARNLPLGDIPGYLDEAIGVAAEIGFDGGRAFALYMKAFRSWRDDADVVDGWRMANEALELARASGYGDVERLSEALLAKLRYVRGEVATALAPLEAAAATLREVGEVFIFGQVATVLAMTKALTGDDAGADELIAELDRLAAETTSTTEVLLAWMARSSVGLVRDDHVEDPGGLDLQLAERAGSRHQRLWGGGVTLILAARQGHADELRERAQELAQLDSHTAMIPAPTLPAGVVAFESGDLGAAERHLCRAIGHMVATGSSPGWARMHCLLTLAAITSRQGEHEVATRIFGSVYGQAAALGVSTATGGWRRCEAGQVDACRAALGDEVFDQVWKHGGALGWEESVAYILRGRGPRKRPSIGWESLTPTELLVVELVAEGLSNKEIAAKLFVSVPTVKSHLTHVYVKLGMRTRAELSAAYARHHASTTPRPQT